MAEPAKNDGDRGFMVRIPRTFNTTSAAGIVGLGLLSLVGGGTGGFLGIGAQAQVTAREQAAAKKEITEKLDAIALAQDKAVKKAEELAASVNDLRSETRVLQSGKFDERLREMERSVAQLGARVDGLMRGGK